jgi:ATP adenylyltransferase
MDFTKRLFQRNITKDFLSKNIYNHIVFESDNFIVIPSLGSLVKGWLLIVPKQYVLSIGYLDENLQNELDELSNNVTKILEKEFGKVTMFEHGAYMPNNLVGCGVDYAHLHLVPVDIDLIAELEKILKINYDWHKISGLDFASIYTKQNLPYLYVKDNKNQHFITSNESFPSQLFRKVIANYLGKSDEFDWKTFHHMENIEATIRILSKYSCQFPECNYVYERAI